MTMTSVGRDNLVRRLAGQNSSVDRKIPKTGGRGKPLPYGMVGNVPQQGTGESGTRPYGKPQGTGESGTRPYGEPRIFPGHGGSPPPLRDGGETSRNGGRAATEGRPYGVSGESQQNRTTRGSNPRKKPQQPGQRDNKQRGEVTMPEQGAELSVLEGTVSSLIFQNEENGYTILRLDVLSLIHI